MKRDTVILGLLATATACNEHPLTPLEAQVSAGVHQTADLPSRPKIDFLLVVDDSGSMAEEQMNLANNFDILARYLHDDLGGRADVRVAVTSTDVARRDAGGFILPKTAGCEDVPAILKIGPGSDTLTADDIAWRMGCLTALGTQGGNREMGLEAMRLALDCNGPNAASFGPCCVPDPGGGDRLTYDRNCTEAPEFNRPDATLVVVFLTDEDDCSDPAANPAASQREICRTGRPQPGDCDPGEDPGACRVRRCDISRQALHAICRHGPGQLDADGIPAAYGDPVYCHNGDRAACFATECEGMDPVSCHRERCAADETTGGARYANASLYTCQWFPEVLTPVEDYRRYLVDLKRDPRRQLVVAAFTGAPAQTEAGHVARYVLPLEPTDAACDAEDLAPTEACCPGGFCEGPPAVSCDSALGRAFAGHRYLELARGFGERGLGCDPGGTCVTLCDGDLSAAVGSLIRVLDHRCFCLDAPPTGDRVTVQMTCLDGTCAPRLLADDEWRLEDTRTDCAGGLAVCLNEPPPPRARLSFDYGRAVGDTPTAHGSY